MRHERKENHRGAGWVYERSRWVEATNPLPEGSGVPKEGLERLGFERHESLKLGDPYGFSIRVYEAEETVEVESVEGPTEAEFLVTLETHLRWHPVFVADLPSLAHFMREIRPLLPEGTE
jgi:hypothetical protein